MSYQDGYFDGYRQARWDIAEEIRKLNIVDDSVAEFAGILADKIEDGEV